MRCFQECLFKLTTYIHDVRHVVLKLDFLSNITAEGAYINLDYNFKIEPYTENITYADWDNQTFSTAGFKLILDRHYTRYVTSYYCPSLLFVIVSWISFTIPPDIVPGRMALLITVLLVAVNLFGSEIQTQPPSQYPTYLNIWMMICIIFVCGALFAYALLMFQQKIKRVKYKITQVNPVSSSADTKNIKNIVPKHAYSWDWDMYCLVIFPSAFLLFNLLYWPIVFEYRQFK